MTRAEFITVFKKREEFEKCTDELETEIETINSTLRDKLCERVNQIHEYLRSIIQLGMKVKAVLELKDLGKMSEEIVTLDNLCKYTGSLWIYGPKDVMQSRDFISFGSTNNVMIKFLIYNPGEDEEG